MAATQPRQRSAGILSTIVQVLVLLLLVAILAKVVQVLLLVMSVANVPSQVSGATSQASRIVSSAQQAVQNATDPHDYVVYKGEMFRISNTVYRVNWLSQETDSVAAGVVRNPDTVTQPLKLDYP